MSPVLLRTVLLALGCATALSAQAPSSGLPGLPGEELVRSGGIIRGRVVRADTGAPLRRVMVRAEPLADAQMREPRAVLTDTLGEYELSALPGGRFRLRADRSGYAPAEHGQRRPGEPGRPLELESGGMLEGIDFALQAGAVIAGRVVDEFGEPVAAAAVLLARYRFTDGARRLTVSHGGSTDDRGEFRVFGLEPGEYYLAAALHHDPALTDPWQYVMTYYPGTAVVEQAHSLKLVAGQELSGILLPLMRARTAVVSGRVRLPDGRAPAFGLVVARGVDEFDGGATSMTALPIADGSFRLGGLVPGTYLVEARLLQSDEYGSVEVTVLGEDVSGVLVTVSRGVAARGRIRFDTGEPPLALRPSDVFVVASAADGPAHLEATTPPVRDDWSFELTGLRGLRLITAGTLSQWQMKAVHVDGIDVTDAPLAFAEHDVDGIEITLTRDFTDVSGTVSGDDGRVQDAVVVVFAEDRDKWGPRSRFMGSARLDQQGRFSIRGLPPSRYRAVAVDFLEEGSERDPERLEGWRSRAVAFSLEYGKPRVIEVTLLPE